MKGVINMNTEKIKFLVMFCLKHDKGSIEEKKFLQDTESILGPIPGVKNFEVLRQTSSDIDYDFAVAMEFDNKVAYEKFNTYPSHIKYGEQRWTKEIVRFMKMEFKDI